MKKFAVVKKADDCPCAFYDSEDVNYELYGGEWSSDFFVKHLEVREDAKDLELKDVKVEVVQVHDRFDYIPNGNEIPAMDSNGDPVLDANGDPVMVQDHDKVEVLKDQEMVVPK